MISHHLKPGYLTTVALILLAVLHTSEVDGCEDGWVLWDEEQMCYFASPLDDLRSFPDSLAACEAYGATLSSQKDLAEKSFIDEYIRICGENCPSSEKYEFWLGLVKPGADKEQSLHARRSEWYWLDGSPYNHTWFNWDATATLEENMEPNNGDPQARLTFHGRWADKDAPYRCRYICKKGVNSTLETQYPATSHKMPQPTTPSTSKRAETSSDLAKHTSKSNSVTATSDAASSSKVTLTPSMYPSEEDKAKMTTQDVAGPISAEETKGRRTGLIIGVTLAALFVVVVTAFIITGVSRLKKRRTEEASRMENRKDIHSYHANLYSQIDETASRYSYSNSIEDIENDKSHMKEKPARNKTGSTMMPKYGDTWTNIGKSPNPYVTNF